MKRRPDPTQGLFRWVWSDSTDDRSDGPGDDLDDDEPERAPLTSGRVCLEKKGAHFVSLCITDPPPLRDRVRSRGEPTTVTLWGVSVTVPKAPRDRAERDDWNPKRKRAAL
jgi:hypothetical protein